MCQCEKEPRLKIYDILESKGHKVIKEYYSGKGFISLLDLCCSNGHEFSLTPKEIHAQYGCPECGKSWIERQAELEKVLNEKHYHLLRLFRDKRNTMMTVRCPEGHETTTKVTYFLQGHYCKKCHGKDISARVKEELEESGFKLLSDYTNQDNLLTIQCSQGHITQKSYRIWRRTKTCSGCYQASRLKKILPDREKKVKSLKSLSQDNLIMHIKKKLSKYNFSFIELLEDKEVKVRCEFGHESVRAISKLSGKIGCTECRIDSMRRTYAEVKKSFEDCGFVLLSEDYINNRRKLDVRCPEGHVFRSSFSDWLGTCPVCNSIKNGYIVSANYHNLCKTSEIQRQCNAEEYELLSEINDDYQDYVSSLKQRIKLKCPNGHIYETSLRSWLRGNRCVECRKDKERKGIDYVRQQIENEGYKLLSDEYLNARTKLKIQCDRGHKYFASWNKWTQGRRCPHCSSTQPLRPEFIKASIESEGYKLLSPFVVTDVPLKVKCPNGHVNEILWSNWKAGKRCRHCSHRLTQKDVQKLLDSDGLGFKCLDVIYVPRENSKFIVECNENHQFESPDGWVKRRSCPLCFQSNRSKGEEILISWIATKGIDYRRGDRKIISPMEIDILLPALQIGIEYGGLYWHSDLGGGRGKYYHLTKHQMSEDKGYRLITIFEDELRYKPEIVKSRLFSILGVTTGFRIHARDCLIKEISYKQCAEFLENFHLQGRGNPHIRLGAFYGGQLVSVMTFSRNNISKNRRKGEFHLELDRFCSDITFCIPGVASKLFTHFIRNYKWFSIISFADKRWSNGNLYRQLGFSQLSDSGPSYAYLEKTKYTTRINRFSLRKNSNDNPDLTEWENRQVQGYDRIWDAGNLRFIKQNIYYKTEEK